MQAVTWSKNITVSQQYTDAKSFITASLKTLIPAFIYCIFKAEIGFQDRLQPFDPQIKTGGVV